MPTTHCIDLLLGSSDDFGGVDLGFADSGFGLAQQDDVGGDFFTQHAGSSGVVSASGTSGECEHPHPLARHFASDPQQHTRCPQALPPACEFA